MFESVLNLLHGCMVIVHTKNDGDWDDYLLGKGQPMWWVYNTHFTENDIQKIVVRENGHDSEIYLK